MNDRSTSFSDMKIFDRKKMLMMSIGTFVGSGVVSILGEAAGVTGYSVWIAYLMAILVGFCSALPYVILSSVMTFSGGVYTVACTFMGTTFGGAYILSTFVSGMGVSMMSAAFGTYVQSVFPSANIQVFAILILVLFWAINCMGVSFMASVQKYSTYILLAALAIFCVVNFTHLNPDTFNFSGPEFMTGGTAGIMGAMAMLVFSCQSYDQNIIPFGKYAIDSRRTVPWTMLMTAGVLVLVYGGVAIAAVGGVDLSTFAGQPLTAVARATLPTVVFYAFIILGPVLCLTTTINGSLANFTVTLEKATEDGWFHKKFASTNRRGASWLILTALTVVCLIPLIFSIDISILTKNTVLLSSFLQIPLLISLWRLPKLFPEAFARNSLKIKEGIFYVCMVIAIAARLLILVWSVQGLTAMNVIGSIIAVAICFLFSVLRSRTGKTKIEGSYSFE